MTIFRNSYKKLNLVFQILLINNIASSSTNSAISSASQSLQFHFGTVQCFLFTDSNSGRKEHLFSGRLLLIALFISLTFYFEIISNLHKSWKKKTNNCCIPFNQIHHYHFAIYLFLSTHTNAHPQDVFPEPFENYLQNHAFLSLSTSFFFPKNKDILYMTTDK